MSNVTLKDVSELTGLSIRSVKRAIQGEHGISQARREEVLKVIRECGYVPNIAARNLRLQRSCFVGIFYSPINRSYVFHQKMTGLQRQLESMGFFTIFGSLKENAADLRTDLAKWAGLVGTVIFLSWNPEWDPESALKFMPQQFIFEGFDSPCNHSMILDRSVGICDGIRYLLKNGRTKIARCGNIVFRAEGFERAFQKAEFKNARYCHFPIPASFDAAYAIGDEIIRKKVDAVFFDTDKMAYGFLKYCNQHHIRIPEDIAVIGFDDDAWDIYSCPALSTVAHPIAEINEAIVDLVLNPRKEPEKKVFETRFIKRESV